jgi:hypothetical protein
MSAREVTDQILSAWEDTEDDVAVEHGTEVEQEEVTAADEPETPEAEEAEEPAEEGEEDEESAGEETEQDEDAEESEEDEPEAESSEQPAAFDDPEVQAYVTRYGDPEKALRAAVELTRILNEQGREKNQLAVRVRELEQEMQQATAFNSVTVLSDEQRVWVDSAVESGNARAYVQEAVRVGEYELARAVCEQMSEETPYDASRLATWVDQAELYNVQRAAQEAEPEDVQVDHNQLMDVLVTNFPQMPEYEEQMVTTLASLGQNHPLAQDARSNDPETAARGIIGIYEIARASNVKVAATRAKVKQEKRQAADSVRADGVVSSGQATPAPGETPRAQRRLGPGLTMEQLDEVWE